ncbi:hypothetical protein BLNAU_3139 [Blattamonas nauphoetae]|uniref:Uncharacterized protein n=1 Tax=Blattamonas nauphoetae TaxID=2049346 RepID=A0ABQ9YD87_9EUKA|nr:hypothetical protein BLNAU_3139 [Blattamonas nauphoetae]
MNTKLNPDKDNSIQTFTPDAHDDAKLLFLRTEPNNITTIEQATLSFMSLVDFIKEGNSLDDNATEQACTLLESIGKAFDKNQILFELVPSPDGQPEKFAHTNNYRWTPSRKPSSTIGSARIVDTVQKRGQQILANLHEEGLADEIELFFRSTRCDIHESRDVALGAQLIHNLGIAYWFLKSLEPGWNKGLAAKLVTELVPSSAGSHSGFVESIATLLTSPNLNVVVATFSFIISTATVASSEIRLHLVQSDLITNVFATIQPHTMPIQGNEWIMSFLYELISLSLALAIPSTLEELDVVEDVERFNHHEMILQKVVLPSDSQSDVSSLNRAEIASNSDLILVNSSVSQVHLLKRRYPKQFPRTLTMQ